MPEQQKDAIHIIDQSIRNLEILKIEIAREVKPIYLGDSHANLTFKANILRKLQANNMSHAIAIAFQNKILQ